MPAPVSILVASLRRPRLLDRCLGAALAQATEAEGLLQVVVAVHEADDESGRVAEAWTRRDARVTVAVTRRLSRSAARNDAAPLCRGDWCWFIDDDAVPLPGAFSALQAAIASAPEAGAVGGPNLLPAGATPFEAASDEVFTSPLGAGPMRRRYHVDGPAGACDERSLIACNLAVRIGPFLEERFNERFDYGEETLLLARLRRRGLLLLRVPSLRVSHQRRPDLAGFAGQAWRSGRGRARQTMVLPSSLAPVCLGPVALALAVLSAPALPAAGAAVATYAALTLAVAAAALPRRGPRAAAWVPLLLATAHLAYGAGFLVELAVEPVRRSLPRGLAARLADWAASRVPGGLLDALFALYYRAAAAAALALAAAARWPFDELRVHRGLTASGWRAGVSDVDLAGVWRDGEDVAPLLRAGRQYALLRRPFPVLHEVLAATARDWERARERGDFRWTRPRPGAAGWERAKAGVDRWAEALHAYVRLSRAVLDEPSGPRRSLTAAKTYLDVVRHLGEAPPAPRREAVAALPSTAAALLAAAERGEDAAVSALAAGAAALLEADALRVVAAFPAGSPASAAPTARFDDPRAAFDARESLNRLERSLGARPRAAVFDSAEGAYLVLPEALGEGAAESWRALGAAKRADVALAGSLLPLGLGALKLLSWSAWGEDAGRAFAWSAAAPVSASGEGPLLRRHVVAVEGGPECFPAPPAALTDLMAREAAAMLLLHWRGRVIKPDGASAFHRWTGLYSRVLSLRARLERGETRPGFPLQPLALAHVEAHPQDAPWLRARVLEGVALSDWEGDLRFLAGQLDALGRVV